MIKLSYNLGDGPKEIELDGHINIYIPPDFFYTPRYNERCIVSKEDACGGSLDEVIQKAYEGLGEVCGYRLAGVIDASSEYVYDVKVKYREDL